MLRNYQRGAVPPWAYQRNGFRVPDIYFHRYTGRSFSNEEYVYVVGQFCRDEGFEHRLAFGSDYGMIGFENAQRHDGPKAYRNVNDNSVSCLRFIPQSPSKLIVADRGKCIYMMEASEGRVVFYDYFQTKDIGYVQSMSVHKDDPNVFVFGSTRGSIVIWDFRERSPAAELASAPKSVIDFAHKIKKSNREDNNLAICNIVHISHQLIATSSGNPLSGIRLWDLRYQKLAKPLMTKKLPEMNRVSSMCIDRRGEKLYALTTRSRVLEYDTGPRELPITAMKSVTQTSPYTTCVYSPISDHLLIGNTTENAFIYDLQREHYYGDVLRTNLNPVVKDYTIPRFRLPDTNREGCGLVDWSADGRFILTLNFDEVKIWDNQWPQDVEFTPIIPGIDGSVNIIDNDQPIHLERFVYDEEYVKCTKDPYWNYTLARRQGIHESDMKVPENLLHPKKAEKRKRVSFEPDITHYFKPVDNLRTFNHQPLQEHNSQN